MADHRPIIMRSFYLLLSAFLITSQAMAASLPKIPNSIRILTIDEVKNFWVNKLPEPVEPSRLSRNYASANVSYHRQVGERYRLVQKIRAGKYDAKAKIVMLRHNIVAYRLRGEDDKLLELAAVLEPLERAEQERRQAEVRSRDADRLERLIAATERLAAAIEKNGGVVPDDADQMVNEIIPFERDRNNRRSLISHLQYEISLCRQPVIIHQSSHGSHPVYSPHDHRTTRPQAQRRPTRITPTRGTVVVVPRPQQSYKPSPTSRPAVVTPRQPQVRQPQVRQAR